MLFTCVSNFHINNKCVRKLIDYPRTFCVLAENESSMIC